MAAQENRQVPRTEPIGGGWWRGVSTCPYCETIHITYTHTDDLLFVPNHRVCALCKLVDAEELLSFL